MTIASCQAAPAERVPALVEQFKGGLAAPICLTWEWTYACNLSCTHSCRHRAAAIPASSPTSRCGR